MNLKILVHILLTLFYFSTLVHADDLLVQLPNGVIRGRQAKTITSKVYYAFQKIPYAAPPIKELRFKPPQPPNSWKGVLNTTWLDVSCYNQNRNNVYETEDCLYLSVYTPKLVIKDDDNTLPVMIFIHGGGFVGGSSINSYSDPILENDVILVTINYRLGPFGFLSTEDEIIPGNNGLKDQHFAIKWVHDNIDLFGGNPKQITIFGASAGSASVAYQLLYQKNEGLFKSAILQSGSFLSPWAYQRRAREIAFATAAFIDDRFSASNDSKTLLDFLLTVDAKTLDTASEQYHDKEASVKNTEILQGFFWAPVIEDKSPEAFLTKKMYGLLQAGNILKVPILIGMNSEESVAWNKATSVVRSNMEAYDQNLSWLVPNDMQVADETTRTKIGEQIRNIYTGGKALAEHLGDGVRYCSDTAFTRSVIKHAELYSKVSKTYFYQFSYDGELGGINVHFDGAETVGHGEESRYIFCVGTKCDLSGYSELDQLTRQRMIKIWTDFAKYQNPTPEPSELLQNITWPLVSTESGDFFYVDINENLEIKNHPKDVTYKEWNKLYNGLGYNDFDTY